MLIFVDKANSTVRFFNGKMTEIMFHDNDINKEILESVDLNNAKNNLYDDYVKEPIIYVTNLVHIKDGFYTRQRHNLSLMLRSQDSNIYKDFKFIVTEILLLSEFKKESQDMCHADVFNHPFRMNFKKYLVNPEVYIVNNERDAIDIAEKYKDEKGVYIISYLSKWKNTKIHSRIHIQKFNYCVLIIKDVLKRKNKYYLYCASSDDIVRVRCIINLDEDNDISNKNIDYKQKIGYNVKIRFFKMFRVKYDNEHRGLLIPHILEVLDNEKEADSYLDISLKDKELINEYISSTSWGDAFRWRNQKDRKKTYKKNPYKSIMEFQEANKELIKINKMDKINKTNGI
jgi:hypothetical protein